MTEPVETGVGQPVRETETPLPSAVEASCQPASDIQLNASEFLDESWADEFDRRLAAWQAASVSVE